MQKSPCFCAPAPKLGFSLFFFWSRSKWIFSPDKCELAELLEQSFRGFVFIHSLFSPLLPQVVAVYGTLSDLLSVASNKLGIKATSVYNGKGGLIDDIALIR